MLSGLCHVGAVPSAVAPYQGTLTRTAVSRHPRLARVPAARANGRWMLHAMSGARRKPRPTRFRRRAMTGFRGYFPGRLPAVRS